MEKNKKYDVGIFGLWYGHNYGSMITYYALDCIVRALGYTTVMINNPLGSNGDAAALRRSHALRFASGHYEIAPLYRLSEMEKINQLCDRFLLGADQMWNYYLSENYGQAYYFDFVFEDRIKVSYATSFGLEDYPAPADYKAEVKKNLRRFSAVSVRDSFSKEICEKNFGVYAEQLIDPVFLCPIGKYDELIEAAEKKFSGHIFAYVLDPDAEFGKVLENIAAKSGKKAVVVFDEEADKQKAIEKLGISGGNVTYFVDATVNEWLGCIQNAEFVITDSFHGICFSVVFRKNFIALKNKKRGGKRFECILDLMGLKSRMVTEASQIEDLFDRAGLAYKIDYGVVENIIKEEKEKGITWLRNALGGRLKIKMPDRAVISVLDKEMCMGCGACVSICPYNAIELKPDSLGYYRFAIDYEKCVNCGLCAGVCPAHRLPDNQNSGNPACFEFVAADEKVLYASSSGGAFPVLAEEAFRRDGIVAGAAWRDDFSVGHILVESREELHKLQKSKYLQSYMGDIFRRIKEKLEENRFVLFSGCPCQVAGLKSYLGKEYGNLLLVDLLCGNSPSTMFFRKYIEEAFPEGIEKYEFRNKAEGWNCDSILVTANGAMVTRRGARQDDYQRVYHNHTMCPPHCEKCRYQKVPRFGDLTIGDFWGIGGKDPSADTRKGISVVLCNNEKGRAFFGHLPAESAAVKKEVPLSWLGGNGYAINGGHNYCSPKRNEFYRAVRTMPFSKAVNYALKPNHGIYDNAGMLHYSARAVHFSFDPAIWEEHFVNGATILTTRKRQTEIGRYAALPLSAPLKRGETYQLRARIKIRTDAPVLNFHIKDSGSNYHQVIYSLRISPKDSSDWVEIAKNFTPDSDIYDEFMFGASQISGENRWLAIDFLNISQ